MQLRVYGIVQGVGFRPFVYKIANKLGYTGYVRNNGSNVEIVLDKDPEEFLNEFNSKLPPLAQVDHLEKINDKNTDDLLSSNNISPGEFKILLSTDGIRDSAIPPDTALCTDCHTELFQPSNRRFKYPFINCTNCGARFSVISDMPYDRDKTSMKDFKLCDLCQQEFTDPDNRRMHAQTISCTIDGPEFTFFKETGRQIKSEDPIKDFCHELDAGAIGIVKSWGGMHIVSLFSETNRLRDWYHRPGKPFAVMARDLEAVKQYCSLNDHTEHLLQLPERPIVLLPKKKDSTHYELIEQLSPGLDTLGVYLPYSAIQYLLFANLEHDALIMTSANPRGEPLIVNNAEVFDLELDAYLLHNRKIINRVDDSLIMPYQNKYFFIRKSRGFVPVPISVNYSQNVLSLGAESNVTATISKNGKMYTSQYIGNTNYYRTLQFLEEATEYLMRLLGINKLDAIAMDLHPQYPTRKLALEFADKFGTRTFEIQHHWSHAASLMLDAGISDELVCLSLDGAGYGADGHVWGGEVLHAQLHKYQHQGSLELIPLIGGDKAVFEPQRLVLGIYECLGMNSEELNYYPRSTVNVFKKMMQNSPLTSSFGRILDALSCYFGIATRRTYDGEPAMKLEQFLDQGKPEYEFKTIIKPDQDSTLKRVSTLSLFKQLFEHVGLQDPTKLSDIEKANLAFSFVNELNRNLIDIAKDAINTSGAKNFGISGGVTYNIPIIRMIESEFNKVKENNNIDSSVNFITHHRLPNGDGGISAGQNVVAGQLINQ